MHSFRKRSNNAGPAFAELATELVGATYAQIGALVRALSIFVIVKIKSDTCRKNRHTFETRSRE